MKGVTPRVLVQCPVRERPVFTGHRMTHAKFEAQEARYGFRCADCGEVHHWTRPDAWLEQRAGVAPAA